MSKIGFLLLKRSTSQGKLSSIFSPQAGIKKWGTDEATFIEIFTTRSFAQLRAMFPEYKKVNTTAMDL